MIKKTLLNSMKEPLVKLISLFIIGSDLTFNRRYYDEVMKTIARCCTDVQLTSKTFETVNIEFKHVMIRRL